MSVKLRLPVPVYRLDERLVFPRPDLADEDGLLAVGGDLRPERLLRAYASGIFPWYSEGLPILWHSPDPRFVLEPRRIHLSRSLRKAIRRGLYEVRYDTAFTEAVEGGPRQRCPGREGTWITEEMRDAYVALHRQGFAHSAESWKGGRLQGGLYGVSLGSVFFGESMFTRAPDASKVAFAALVARLIDWRFTLID